MTESLERERPPAALSRHAPAVVLVVLLLALSYVGWRSVFIGGWHSSGDGSYECPSSPWHTIRHPSDPDRFGDAAALASACDRDARQVVVGWAVAEGLAAGLTLLVVAASIPGDH